MPDMNTRLIYLACIYAMLGCATLVHGYITYADIPDEQLCNECQQEFDLDLNGDTVIDIGFSGFNVPSQFPGIPDSGWFIALVPDPSRVVGSGFSVSLLDSGFMIGSSLPGSAEWVAEFDPAIRIAGPYYDPPPLDPNLPGMTGFVGLEFDISGETHYGWVRVKAHDATGTGIVYDYAYETEPGVGIEAGMGVIPEPATGILLMLGAIGLLWRGRRRQ